MMNRTKKYVIASAIFLFFLIPVIIFLSFQIKTENGLTNEKETIKEQAKKRPVNIKRQANKGISDSTLNSTSTSDSFSSSDSASTSDFKKKLKKNKYLLVESSSLTWQKFGEKLKEGDDKFVETFSKFFTDLEWNGVFFECKAFIPLKAETEIVEFRLVKTDRFIGIDPNHSKFDEHLIPHCPNDSVGAISFLNIGKDSTLVSPCPAGKELIGTHIMSFMKSATLEQKKALLKKVGEVILEKISEGGDKKIWLSTSGTEVPWLHVRFDPRPKYYSTTAYEQ